MSTAEVWGAWAIVIVVFLYLWHLFVDQQPSDEPLDVEDDLAEEDKKP